MAYVQLERNFLYIVSMDDVVSMWPGRWIDPNMKPNSLHVIDIHIYLGKGLSLEFRGQGRFLRNWILRKPFSCLGIQT